jgi:hypothetical protein
VVSFTSREKVPGVHCREGWMGFRVGLDALEGRENLLHLKEIKPRLSSLKPVTIPTEL